MSTAPALWRQCLSCCRGVSDDNNDDTKLCQLTLTLNCCAHHNATYTVTTDGVEEEEEEKRHDEKADYRRNEE